MIGCVVIGVFVVMAAVVIIGVYQWGYRDGRDERRDK